MHKILLILLKDGIFTNNNNQTTNVNKTKVSLLANNFLLFIISLNVELKHTKFDTCMFYSFYYITETKKSIIRLWY